MSEKCCCGCCDLSSGAQIALAICALQACIGLIWHCDLLNLLNKYDTFSPLDLLINVDAIEDFDVVHGLVLAAIGLNCFWVIFAIVAARGNVTLKHGRMAFWDMLTYLITIFDLGATIYFSVKLAPAFAESPDFYSANMKPSKTLTYLVLLIAFSRGGVFILFNVYMAHIVQKRGKEIDHDHSVLAMYIISHLARCRPANEEILHMPPPPPPYASSAPYYEPLPPSRPDARSDSDGSQWSLSYDAIQGMSHEPPKYVPPQGRRKYSSALELARSLSRDPTMNCETVTVDTATSPILPY
ncbi:hypothetical protein AVEN_311-1 [Araneus ventricosus]|uniref:Uncharacterized protein n=1 Tax=Araneus ventricosus TaxID=182803 RepID=A0A4Y2I346_ARAVE|nr:hypothetical protein AVEN_311-1 [Araneus ventricosus]